MLCKPSSRRRTLQRRLARRRAGGVKSCADSKQIRSCKTLRQQTCSLDKSLTENDAPTIKFAFRYHGTQQYSITALTDSLGTIKERYAYDAYGGLSIFDGSGTARTTTAEGSRYTYTGREYDDVLDLYHYRARMYDSIVGRFCSRDPIGYEGSKLGLQGFADGRPTSGSDPLGDRWTEPEILGGGPPTGGEPGIWPHQEKNTRCIFVMNGIEPGNVPGLSSMPTNGGVLVPNVTSGQTIVSTIKNSKCCEIFVVGHQSLSLGNPGGIHASPEGAQKPYIPILPSKDGSTEKDIRDALEGNGCKGCGLFMYSCGALRLVDSNGNVVVSYTEEERDGQRQQIADSIGCSVYGGTRSMNYGKKQYDSPCRSEWGKCSLGAIYPTTPFPLIKFPSNNPIR
ncbi:tRNA nuclease WapA precursor [Stieleria neptunia]|uniref:tRNA nuclease WapA n=1 Tax=Stieleria neptunia TaxID=2527979 RepID=A0A518HNY1_9BACT|nr:RHS repeat-associated core domain-containing protein [Stieleria neptunia]QDV42552.1 tRNA nuclease WapA precursor [Stieleria neptunia]